jgi:hypothetical protein
MPPSGERRTMVEFIAFHENLAVPTPAAEARLVPDSMFIALHHKYPSPGWDRGNDGIGDF